MSSNLRLEWPGSLLALSGIDFCGKGVQTKLLAQVFQTLLGDDSVVVTEEPWRNPQSPNGLRIDRLLRAKEFGIVKEVNPGDGKLVAEAFQTLYVCDRYTHWVKLILPAMLEGKLVISDRERMSTYAYGHAFGLSLEQIHSWHVLLPPPDMTIWIDITAEEALRRKSGRTKTVEHFEDPRSLRLTAQAYLDVFESGLIPNVVRIDGMGSTEEVFKRILDAVADYLPETRQIDDNIS